MSRRAEPSHPPVEDLREAAGALADLADPLAMAYFGGPVASVSKPDGSPVTEADRAVESALRERIARDFADHAVLGEEQGGAIDPDRPTWVIDPIDATRNFMRGIPVFATLIAVMLHGRAVVGVVSAPAMGERWDAGAGLGTRRNGALVGVSAVRDVAESLVCHGGLEWFREDPAHWERLGRVSDATDRMRGFGDFWMHLLVAGGMAEAAFERDLSLWDLAALACIVPEAGGAITTWDGGDALTGDGSVISSNSLVHDQICQLLGR